MTDTYCWNRGITVPEAKLLVGRLAFLTRRTMQIYGIYFNRGCGNSHFAFARVTFATPPPKNVSVGKFYESRQFPNDLKNFLARPFVCPTNHDITALPELDESFFQREGSTLHVA